MVKIKDYMVTWGLLYDSHFKHEKFVAATKCFRQKMENKDNSYGNRKKNLLCDYNKTSFLLQSQKNYLLKLNLFRVL